LGNSFELAKMTGSFYSECGVSEISLGACQRTAAVVTTATVFVSVICLLAGPVDCRAAESSNGTLEQFLTKCGYAVVPLKNGVQNKFYVVGKINGSRVNCLIDTGTYDVIVDSARATNLKSLGKRSESRTGVFGKIASEIETVVIDRLDLASTIISNQQAIALDLHKNRQVLTGSLIARSQLPDQKDIILGQTFFKDANVIIDCAKPALYIRAEKPGAVLAEVVEKSLKMSGFAPVPIRLGGRGILIRGEINDRPALFLLDTGSLATVFNLPQLKDFGLSDHERLGRLQDLGAHNEELRFTKVPSLKLGDFTIQGLRVGVSTFPDFEEMNLTLKKSGSPPMLGYLGPEVLASANALIDFSSEKVYLRKTAK
jgi:predicted aspartyl protease